MDLFQFFNEFGTIKNCADYFIQQEIVYTNLYCECGKKMKLTTHGGKTVFRCTKYDCRKQKNLFYGTIFSHCMEKKLPKNNVSCIFIYQ